MSAGVHRQHGLSGKHELLRGRLRGPDERREQLWFVRDDMRGGGDLLLGWMHEPRKRLEKLRRVQPGVRDRSRLLQRRVQEHLVGFIRLWRLRCDLYDGIGVLLWTMHGRPVRLEQLRHVRPRMLLEPDLLEWRLHHR